MGRWERVQIEPNSKNIDVYPISPGPDHQTNGDGKCWCEPELSYQDESTGKKVYLHKEIQ